MASIREVMAGIPQYKTIDVYVETDNDWRKHMDDKRVREQERLAAIQEGFKGVEYRYNGPAISSMIDTMNEEMKRFRRDYIMKSVKSEQEAEKIIINC